METSALFVTSLTALGLIAFGTPLRAAGLRVKIPPAVSLMALGVIVGTSGLDILPDAYRDASSFLSRTAFVVLLLRAGLGISPKVLRNIALPALVIGIVPVAVELGIVTAGARWLFFSDMHLALLAGFLVAAVSPAVILPAMLDQKHKGRGGARHVPDRIIAQTVINAVIAQTGILLMLDILDPQTGRSIGANLALLPVNLLGGAMLGVVAGTLLRLEWIAGKPTPALPPLRIWGAVAAALLVSLLVYFGCGELGLESVIATLAVGITLRSRLEWCERDLQIALRRLWSVAEIFLFVNLGANIEISRLGDVTLVFSLVALMALALLCRVAVARRIVERTGLTPGEKAYVTTAQLPKATIQAVFGAVIYLRLSSEGGAYSADAQTLLIMAVLAIVTTAPIGALLLDRWGERMLAPATDAGSPRFRDKPSDRSIPD